MVSGKSSCRRRVSNRPSRSLRLLCAYCAIALSACAAIPTASSGVSTPSFDKDWSVPMRVVIDSERIQGYYDPVGDVLRATLPGLGFDVVHTGADAVLISRVRTSDFSPVNLELTLNSAVTGRTLWSASVSKSWDVYASIVRASELNAEFAMELLEKDLSRARTIAAEGAAARD